MAISDGRRARPPAEDVAVFENVLVTQRSEFGWYCVINGRAVFLGPDEIAPGTTMPHERQHGQVTLMATAADALNLRLRHP